MTDSSDASRLDQLCIDTLRCLAIDAVQRANSGHPGMPMGMAPAAYVLWTRHLRHNPADPKWPARDRFVLSAGHGSMLLYGLLHLTGYDLPLDELERFRQLGSKTPGHPEYGHTPGVETTTGPLGQGFGNGVGMALAQRHLAATFHQPGFELLEHHVYGIVSDGDLMEGVASEAASLAGHLRLGNLVYLYDDNGITIDGSTELTFTEDVGKRFEAYGWHVQLVGDGNDLAAIDAAIVAARAERDRPSLIRVKTRIGFGSPNKEGSEEAHGAPLGVEEVRLTKQRYGWDPEAHFHIPKEALDHFREAVARGARLQAEWQGLLERYVAVHPGLGEELRRRMDGKLPEGWTTALPDFAGTAKLATRQAQGKVLNALADRIPELIGGSADLTGSNGTLLKEWDIVRPGALGGRNLHFGIREHAMAAAVNGMALSGMLIPYGATFLVFSDYCRPSIRLAAMMKLRAVFSFTHDSIGLGEDGPTHQPVEQLTALRAIPNLAVVRPADAMETAQAWRLAIERTSGPTALALTRQSLPVLDRSRYGDAQGTLRGGYVLFGDESVPQVILMGSGSEVCLCLEAAELLEREGLKVRVVSMPCMEVFEAQPAAYREQVLPKAVRARVAVEAALSMSWARYVEPSGAYVCMDSFGASAPYEQLYEHFGFTAKNIAARAREALARST